MSSRHSIQLNATPVLSAITCHAIKKGCKKQKVEGSHVTSSRFLTWAPFAPGSNPDKGGRRATAKVPTKRGRRKKINKNESNADAAVPIFGWRERNKKRKQCSEDESVEGQPPRKRPRCESASTLNIGSPCRDGPPTTSATIPNKGETRPTKRRCDMDLGEQQPPNKKSRLLKSILRDPKYNGSGLRLCASPAARRHGKVRFRLKRKQRFEDDLELPQRKRVRCERSVHYSDSDPEESDYSSTSNENENDKEPNDSGASDDEEDNLTSTNGNNNYLSSDSDSNQEESDDSSGKSLVYSPSSTSESLCFSVSSPFDSNDVYEGHNTNDSDAACNEENSSLSDSNDDDEDSGAADADADEEDNNYLSSNSDPEESNYAADDEEDNLSSEEMVVELPVPAQEEIIANESTVRSRRQRSLQRLKVNLYSGLDGPYWRPTGLNGAYWARPTTRRVITKRQ